jgi:hypothetical protein
VITMTEMRRSGTWVLLPHSYEAPLRVVERDLEGLCRADQGPSLPSPKEPDGQDGGATLRLHHLVVKGRLTTRRRLGGLPGSARRATRGAV